MCYFNFSREEWVNLNKKGENFKRLAENRTNKIINMLHLLGNLSNTSNYEYTDEQVRLMFDTLEKELDIQRQKFKRKSNRGKKIFRL